MILCSYFDSYWSSWAAETHTKYENDLKCLTDSFDTNNFQLTEKLTNWLLVTSTPDGYVHSLKTYQ